MVSNPEFQVPIFSEDENDDEAGYVIEPDNPTIPTTEYRLKKKLGGKTRLRGLMESYGPRNKAEKDRGGWYLAAGAIVVTAVGIEYFRRNHPDEEEK